MLIDIKLFSSLCLTTAGIVALVFLSIALCKLCIFITNLNNTLTHNRELIDKVCSDLPEITDNVKTVTNVVNETTNKAVSFKEDFLTNFNPITEILTTIFNLIFKK